MSGLVLEGLTDVQIKLIIRFVDIRNSRALSEGEKLPEDVFVNVFGPYGISQQDMLLLAEQLYPSHESITLSTQANS